MRLPELSRSQRYAAGTLALVTAMSPPSGGTAQVPVIIRGGWVFTAASDEVVRNRGILVRGGVFQVVNGEVTPADTLGARTITLGDDDDVLPGLVDVHALQQ